MIVPLPDERRYSRDTVPAVIGSAEAGIVTVITLFVPEAICVAAAASANVPGVEAAASGTARAVATTGVDQAAAFRTERRVVSGERRGVSWGTTSP